MNSGAHQKIVSQLKTGMIPIRVGTFIVAMAFAKLGVLPFYPGIILCCLLLTEGILRRWSTYVHTNKNFLSLAFSLCPIWILYFDPCALMFSTTMSYFIVRSLLLEENRRQHRTFYIALLIASWATIVLLGSTFIDECPSTISDNLRKDATLIIFTLTFTVSAMKRGINEILCELRDSLTEVKALNSRLESLNKELKNLLEAKDNFILLFSHETRNPLNILIGNLTLLLSEVGSVQIKTKLERCKFCADLLLQQLNNILDSGKLSSRGTLEQSPTPVNLNEFIPSISSFIEMLIKKKETVKAELIIPESLPTVLKFDMQRCTQVCLNLLTNAQKFTKAGSISLVVRYIRKNELQESDYYPSTDFGYRLLNWSKKQERDLTSQEIGEESGLDTQIGIKMQFTREIANLQSKKKSFTGVIAPEKGFLKIEVNDTGCGIKPEDMKHLFKKFCQTHANVSQLQVGSGLGLWITKSLCELLGGGTRAYSAPNVGSCFVAVIRADCLPSSRAGVATSPLTPGIKSSVTSNKQETKRILLVDDDPFNLEFHSHIITSLGYDSIETATNGQELFEQFKVKPEGYFDTIVTDIAMPHLDGISAAKLIRKFEEDQRRSLRVKIGFITGHSNHKDQAACEKGPLNCLFYLSKPIKPEMIEGFLPALSPAPPAFKRVSSNFKRLCSNTSSRKQSFSLVASSVSLTTSSPLVLCVDDDVFNLDFLEDMIKSLGARAIKAKSGEESLAFMRSVISTNAKERIPNLVLMDCKMPNLTGWATCKMMKEIIKKEDRVEVPIVGITGEDKVQSQEKLKSSKMSGMIQKPIQFEELRNLLKKYALIA